MEIEFCWPGILSAWMRWVLCRGRWVITMSYFQQSFSRLNFPRCQWEFTLNKVGLDLLFMWHFTVREFFRFSISLSFREFKLKSGNTAVSSTLSQTKAFYVQSVQSHVLHNTQQILPLLCWYTLNQQILIMLWSVPPTFVLLPDIHCLDIILQLSTQAVILKIWYLANS